MQIVTRALLSGTTAAAILSVIALLLLLYAGWQKRKSPYWYPMTFWVAHVALFFVSNVTVRIFYGYTFPTVTFSGWGIAIYLQALVSIVGITIVKLSMDRVHE